MNIKKKSYLYTIIKIDFTNNDKKYFHIKR